MNWAYALLGISADADATTIKRAYARLLRTTRPDEDAAAFQRLNTAYQTALAQAAQRPAPIAAVTLVVEPAQSPAPPITAQPSAPAATPTAVEMLKAPAASTPAPVERSIEILKAQEETRSPVKPAPKEVLKTSAPPSPVAPPAPLEVLKAAAPTAPKTAVRPLEVLHPPEPKPVRVIPPKELAEQAIREAANAKDPDQLSSWLDRKPEFWSLQVKQATGQLLLQQLLHEPQAMAATSLDTLLRFFDLDHVLSGVSPVALQQLRQRQLTMWELVPDNHRLLALRMRRLWGQQPNTLLLGDDIALLQRPFRWLAALHTALQIGSTRELGRLALTLSNNGHLDQLPPSINRQHTQFWLAAVAHRGAMTWPRFAIGSFRAGLAALTVALIVLGVAPFMPGNSKWLAMAALPSFAAIGTFCIWLLFVGCAWFDHWQGLPESTSSRWPWLRRLAIPMLCACSLALCEATTSSYATWTTVLVCVFAVRRFRHRLTVTSNAAKIIRQSLPAAIFVLIVIANPLIQELRDRGLTLSEVIACVAICVWIVDMTRHRAYLRLKSARS